MPTLTVVVSLPTIRRFLGAPALKHRRRIRAQRLVPGRRSLVLPLGSGDDNGLGRSHRSVLLVGGVFVLASLW